MGARAGFERGIRLVNTLIECQVPRKSTAIAGSRAPATAVRASERLPAYFRQTVLTAGLTAQEDWTS